MHICDMGIFFASMQRVLESPPTRLTVNQAAGIAVNAAAGNTTDCGSLMFGVCVMLCMILIACLQAGDDGILCSAVTQVLSKFLCYVILHVRVVTRPHHTSHAPHNTPCIDQVPGAHC
jgi:hypothetical protein